METAVEAPQGAQKGDHEPPRRLVAITIDNNPYELRPGQHPVTELKAIGGVPSDYELEQVVGGKLVPLDDGGKVLIKGGEVFVSHPKDAASS